MPNLLEKIAAAGLIGRGGAAFPTHLKWRAVSDAPNPIKYLVVNGSEGEPGVHKDRYILANYPDELVSGIKLTADFIAASKIYVYLNHKYFLRFKKDLSARLNRIGLKGKFELVIKTKESGYIGGEETTMLNILEGRRAEPRLRPPWPTEGGLWSAPTLIHNIETLYNVNLVATGRFKHQRFYSISRGDKLQGVYCLADDLSLAEVLRRSGHYPTFPFFVQAGGGAGGEVLNQKQLRKKVSGSGAIIIHDLLKHRPEQLVKSWLDFFAANSCGRCLPCREGTYRLKEMLDDSRTLSRLLRRRSDLIEITDSLSSSSFCSLGCLAPVAFLSYIKNVYKFKDRQYETKNRD